jgi:hypothetical protein
LENLHIQQYSFPFEITGTEVGKLKGLKQLHLSLKHGPDENEIDWLKELKSKNQELEIKLDKY